MKKLLLLLVLLGGFTAFGQGTITGSLMDMDLGGPLPGANVIEAGTNNGVVTDFDGNFSITVANNQGTLELSYVGYQTKTVSYTLSGETLALGSISVNQAAASLDEVILIGSGVIQVAEGRRTPVAVSTIRAEEISTKALVT